MDKKKYIQDTEYLLHQLPILHKNLYSLITKEKFLSIGESIINKIKEEEFREKDFNLLLLSLLSAIKDPHTSTYTNGQKVPIFFEWVFDGYYPFVVPKDSEKFLGKKLIKINGLDIEKFCKEEEKYIVFDNEERKKIELSRFLNDEDIIQYITHNTREEVRYTFENNKTISLNAVDSNIPIKQTSIYGIDGNKYLDVKYSYYVEEKENTLYLKYTRCSEDPKYKIKDFVKDIKDILKNNPKKIVVDLRNNAGGDSSLFSPILSVLKTYKKTNNPQRYCLINRRVFSSGVLNTYDIKNKLKAILVGQPTGQGVNHFGEIKILVLPNSKIEIQYSSKYFKLINDDSHNIFPDVFIEPKIEDIMNGIDPVLEYCNKH